MTEGKLILSIAGVVVDVGFETIEQFRITGISINKFK